jgi:DNA-binding CsgD family transcriptional regulator
MAAPMIGHLPIVTHVRQLLASATSVLLTGPAGIGRSTVLRALAEGFAGPVWRLSPSAADAEVPYVVLNDLVRQFPAAAVEALPVELRVVVMRLAGVADGVARIAGGQAGLAGEFGGVASDFAGEVGAGAGKQDGGCAGCREWGPLRVRQALRALVMGSATDAPEGSGDGGARAVWGLLLVDDCQWVDEASAAVLEHVVRRVPGLGVVFTARGGTVSRLAGKIQLRVPALGPDQLAELHDLPMRQASRIHAASGGNPKLALALNSGQPVAGIIGELMAPLDDSARETLTFAALAWQPALRTLARAGRQRAAQDIAAAMDAGLIEQTGERLIISAGAVAAHLVTSCDPSLRRRAHEALTGAADDPDIALWHRASIQDTPDPLLARELRDAAAARRADPVLAAELGLRAASLAGSARSMTAEIALAARDAAAGGRADLVQRAVHLLELAGASRADLVRARIAVADAAGQALDGLDELLARARAESAGYPEMLAQVLLRLALRANLAEGSPQHAIDLAQQAAEHAEAAGDQSAQAIALTMVARMRRVLGEADAETVLAQALALPEPPVQEGLRNSPRYLAVRHAIFDDRLAEARAALLAILPQTQANGIAEDLVDVLRSLAEVEVRSGRCQQAMAHAARAIAAGEQGGVSPGPAWYTAAVTELAGGRGDRALVYALRAQRASREEGDQVFLARALHITGLIQLASHDPAAATGTLRQVQELEAAQHVYDPSLLRWHGDLAEALVLTGSADEGRELIGQWRRVAVRLGRRGVLAALDRAEGIYLGTIGEAGAGVSLLANAADSFAALGMPIEQGRCLIALTVVERRRRRRAAAHQAQREASELFTRIGADGWLGLAQITAEPDGAHHGLTGAETQVAELVAAGASNREVAATLFLSVKTVESMLTRIYRRLGVRSRTQLAMALKENGPVQGVSPIPGTG